MADIGNWQTQLSQTQFDKTTVRETIYKYVRKFPIEVHRERGQNLSIFISCRYLVELGPRNWVYRFPKISHDSESSIGNRQWLAGWVRRASKIESDKELSDQTVFVCHCLSDRSGLSLVLSGLIFV